MRLLLDSHTLLWAVDEPARLGAAAAAALKDPANELLLSAATIWEISIKVGLGKLRLSKPFLPWMTQAMTDLGVMVLAITAEFADAQAKLPSHHRDPFDRMLVAQASVESVAIVSGDTAFARYGIARIW